MKEGDKLSKQREQRCEEPGDFSGLGVREKPAFPPSRKRVQPGKKNAQRETHVLIRLPLYGGELRA